MTPTRLKQEAQATTGGIIVQKAFLTNGLSETKVTQLFLDLYYANFPKLIEQATEIAASRMERVIKRIADAQRENPEPHAWAEPAVQMGILDAIRVAVSNEQATDLAAELAATLAKGRNSSKDRKSIREAIAVAEKLGSPEVAALSVILHCTRLAEPAPQTKSRAYEATVADALRADLLGPFHILLADPEPVRLFKDTLFYLLENKCIEKRQSFLYRLINELLDRGFDGWVGTISTHLPVRKNKAWKRIASSCGHPAATELLPELDEQVNLPRIRLTRIGQILAEASANCLRVKV